MRDFLDGLYGFWLDFTDDLRNLWREFVERGREERRSK